MITEDRECAMNLDAQGEDADEDGPDGEDKSLDMSKLNGVQILRLNQLLNEEEALALLQDVSKALRGRRGGRKG